MNRLALTTNPLLTVITCGSLHASLVSAALAAPDFTVIVGEPSPAPVEFAARTLARYVTEAIGAPCKVLPDGRWAGQHAVLLVPSAASNAVRELRRPARSHDEAYRIHTLPEGGRGFSGHSPRAVLFAVYDFLEQTVGYRWYFPYPEDHLAPRLTPEALSSRLRQTEDRETQPAFGFRSREFRDVAPMTARTDERIVQQIDWWAKLRMNRFLFNFQDARKPDLWERWRARLIPEIKRRGMLVGLGEHGSYPLFLPPARYAALHPEWYCEIAGQRVPGMRTATGHETQFCTSNEDAVAAYLDNFAAFARQHPEIDFYYPAPNDIGQWCECGQCRNLSIADRYLRLNNRVAARLNEVRPGTRVMHLAYDNHRLPPAQTRPHPLIAVDVACWGRDFAYPLCDPRTMPGDADYLDVFRQWARLSRDPADPLRPRLLYHYKLMRHYWLGLHLQPLTVMDADFDCIRDLGVDGFDLPLGFLGIWTKALNAYVAARKCWDPDEPTAPLVTRFLGDYYGTQAAEAGRIYGWIAEAFHDRRYGHSLALAWFPATTALRETPLAGLGDHARHAVDRLETALALADAIIAKAPPETDRFKKLHSVLRRARDEQRVLVGFDDLMRAYHAMQSAPANTNARTQARQTWKAVQGAVNTLAAGYDLEEDLAGLYWAGSSHLQLREALDIWSVALEGLHWQRLGHWETADFNDSTALIVKHFDVTRHVAGRIGEMLQVRFVHRSGELAASISAVTLDELRDDGTAILRAEDRHGGYAGYVHNHSVYHLKIPGDAPKQGRYRLTVSLAAVNASGRVAQRGSNGDILLGVQANPTRQ